MATAAAPKAPSGATVNLDEKFTSDPVDWNEYGSRWDMLWQRGISAGQRWDCGDASPALLNLISTGTVPVQGKRLLVPGCGRGYDVVACAVAGANAVGLELSPTAVEAAAAHRDAQNLPAETTARATFVEGNFFEFNDPQGPFDIGYDYTFFCALHPSMRTTWAESWARLLKPGGELIALVFPIDPNADQTMGPPYPVKPELYHAALEPAGFECISMEAVPAELSHKGRAGKEFLGRFRRRAQ